MRGVSFHANAFEDFTSLAVDDPKRFNKILSLIRETMRSPFSGTGKPEPLKHELAGYWSRRIDHVHRLIYTVTDERITIISCQYHYEK